MPSLSFNYLISLAEPVKTRGNAIQSDTILTCTRSDSGNMETGHSVINRSSVPTSSSCAAKGSIKRPENWSRPCISAPLWSDLQLPDNSAVLNIQRSCSAAPSLLARRKFPSTPVSLTSLVLKYASALLAVLCTVGEQSKPHVSVTFAKVLRQMHSACTICRYRFCKVFCRSR